MAGAFATVYHRGNAYGFAMPRDTWPSVHAPTRAGADIFCKTRVCFEILSLFNLSGEGAELLKPDGFGALGWFDACRKQAVFDVRGQPF